MDLESGMLCSVNHLKNNSKQPDFVSLSFETIAGSGPNGAIIHYKPEKPTCAKIEISKMFLCDSGGQYR